jgi:DNA-binding NtrC family response regulator
LNIDEFPGLSVPGGTGNLYMTKSIVIVDDEPNIGPSLQLILEREGYSVSIYRSAQDFAARHSTRRADAYLLDVRLPDGNGIDILRSLRQADQRAPWSSQSYPSRTVRRGI